MPARSNWLAISRISHVCGSARQSARIRSAYANVRSRSVSAIDSMQPAHQAACQSEGDHADCNSSYVRTLATRQPRISTYQLTNLPIYQLPLLSLRFVLVRTFDVLRSRDRIVGEPVLVDPVVVRVPHLRYVGRPVPFHCSLVRVRVGLGRRAVRHRGLLTREIVEVAAAIIVG